MSTNSRDPRSTGASERASEAIAHPEPFPHERPLPLPIASEGPEPNLDHVVILRGRRDGDGCLAGLVIEFANEANAAVAALPADRLVGADLADAHPSFAGFTPQLMAILDAGRPHRQRMVQPLDPSRTAQVQVTPLDRDRLLVVIHETTEEDRLREALRTSDARLRSALDHVPETMAIIRPILDEDGHFVDGEALYLNRVALQRFFGGARFDEVRNPIFANYPETKARLFELYRDIIEKNESFHGERLWMLSSGSIRVEVTITLTPEGIVHSSRDITEAHEARVALERSLADLAEAQRIAHVGSWSWDPATDTPEWSEEHWRIYGLEPGVPPPFYGGQEQLQTPESRARLEAAVARTLRDGTPYELEVDIVRGDGGVALAMTRGEAVRDEQGRVVRLHGTIADITEIRRTQQELRDSLRELSEAQRIGHVGSWSWDALTDRTRWAPEMYRILGMPEDTTPTTFTNADLVVTSESARALVVEQQRLLREGGSFEVTVDIDRPDGEVRHALVRAEAQLDAAGKVVGLRGTLADITELKRSQEALRASEERFAAVIGAVHEAIAIVRPVDGGDAGDGEASDFVVEWVNPTWFELLGGGDRDPRGRYVLVEHPELARLLPDLRGALSLGEKRNIELRISDGRWLSVDVGPLGETLLVVVRDVTGRRAAEEARRARLISAIEQTSEAILIADADWITTYVNPAYEELTGARAADVVGRDARASGRSAAPPDAIREILGRLASGQGWHGEVVNRRVDGSLYTAVASLSPIRDEAGATTGYVAVMQDVTAKHELEEQLRRSQRLEAVGQLAGGIAHDFNNIIGAITGYGQLVQGSLPTDSESWSDMAEVLRAAQRAAGLTRQLLAFSRRQALEPRVVDPAAVIEDLVPMLRPLIGAPVQLVVEHAPGTGRVMVDPGQLEQVIVNLAVNARDAMPDGGRLTIAIANVADVTSDDLRGGVVPSRVVRITVSDTGTGMDEATLARIFEPFFTTKEPGRGTGMGLATVYGIVHQSGGRISASSVPGRGSTFTIDLPRVDTPAERERPFATGSPVAAGRGERVLLVDDDPAIRGILGRALERRGYRVVEAASGGEALDAAGSSGRPLQLLVTDVRMPGMQGPELARRLRAELPSIPLIFITGTASEAGADGGRGDPVRGIEDAILLVKPFEIDALLGAVREALDSRR